MKIKLTYQDGSIHYGCYHCFTECLEDAEVCGHCKSGLTRLVSVEASKLKREDCPECEGTGLAKVFSSSEYDNGIEVKRTETSFSAICYTCEGEGRITIDTNNTA